MSKYLDWCQEENCKPWSRTALNNGVIERIRGAHKQKKSKGIYSMGVDWASEAEELAESGLTK
jgi:hypothetical protein